MSGYNVFTVIYKGAGEGWCAVAVSAESGSAAMARVRGNRPAEFMRAFRIDGRKPQYAQDRIEGTCDLRNQLLPPPEAGTKSAEEIRTSNRVIIEDWLTGAPRYRTVQRLKELALPSS